MLFAFKVFFFRLWRLGSVVELPFNADDMPWVRIVSIRNDFNTEL